MRIADLSVGDGAPLVLIAGLNVLEGERAALDCAERVQGLSERHGMPCVFKASFDSFATGKERRRKHIIFSLWSDTFCEKQNHYF